jgi:hypothetical protein
MEEALTALLLGDARVALIFGDRIHWISTPQGVTGYPRAVLQVASGGVDVTNDGPSGLESARVQIDSYGKTYADAKAGSDAILGLLSGYRGVVGGVRIHAGFVDSKRDLPASDSGDGTKLFRRSADIFIWHS